MGFEQYHEPANELPEKTRTFARMIVSMIEEAEAINRRRNGGWCYKTFCSKRETLSNTAKKPNEITAKIGAKADLKPKIIPRLYDLA